MTCIGVSNTRPAPHGEQRVSSEQQILLLEPIDDVPGGMSGRLDDPRPQFADRDDIVLGDTEVDAADPGRLLRRGHDAGLRKARLQRKARLARGRRGGA